MFTRFLPVMICMTACINPNLGIAQEIESNQKERNTFYISPTAAFIPHGVNSIEGLSLGMIKPISETWDGYLEMMGMTTFSTDIEDSFEFDDWHQSTYWGLELGGLRYFSLERFDSDRLIQLSIGLMYRSGSEELLLDPGDDSQVRNDRRTKTYQGNDYLLFTRQKKLNDLGLSIGSAYEIPWWEGINSYAGGRVYLTPSGEHFFRFSFQVFYDL